MTYEDFKIDWFLKTYGDDVFMMCALYLEAEVAEYADVEVSVKTWFEQAASPAEILFELQNSSLMYDGWSYFENLFKHKSWPDETLYRLSNLEAKVDLLLAKNG